MFTATTATTKIKMGRMAAMVERPLRLLAFA
jgi:hypothetical protein